MEEREGAFQAGLKVVWPSFSAHPPNWTWGSRRLETGWEKTLQAAQREGRVNLYICSTCSVTAGYERVLEEFKKEYPRLSS